MVNNIVQLLGGNKVLFIFKEYFNFAFNSISVCSSSSLLHNVGALKLADNIHSSTWEYGE